MAIIDPFVSLSAITNLPTHAHTTSGWTSTTVGHSQPFTGMTMLNSSSSNKSISINELIDVIDVLKQRMLILTPLFEKHERYPALLAAYSDYLLIERLITEDITK